MTIKHEGIRPVRRRDWSSDNITSYEETAIRAMQGILSHDLPYVPRGEDGEREDIAETVATTALAVADALWDRLDEREAARKRDPDTRPYLERLGVLSQR